MTKKKLYKIKLIESNKKSNLSKKIKNYLNKFECVIKINGRKINLKGETPMNCQNIRRTKVKKVQKSYTKL